MDSGIYFIIILTVGALVLAAYIYLFMVITNMQDIAGKPYLLVQTNFPPPNIAQPPAPAVAQLATSTQPLASK